MENDKPRTLIMIVGDSAGALTTSVVGREIMDAALASTGQENIVLRVSDEEFEAITAPQPPVSLGIRYVESDRSDPYAPDIFTNRSERRRFRQRSRAIRTRP